MKFLLMMLIAVFALGLSLLSLKINERSCGVGVSPEKVSRREEMAMRNDFKSKLTQK